MAEAVVQVDALMFANSRQELFDFAADVVCASGLERFRQLVAPLGYIVFCSVLAITVAGHCPSLVLHAETQCGQREGVE